MFRQKSSSPSPFLLKILGGGLYFSREDSSAIFLVEHPLVARIIAKRGLPVFYIHGEIAAPEECVIPGITKCFGPLGYTRERMVGCGATPDTIIVSGLVIEPELVSNAERNYNLRLERLNSNQPLTVAFFISKAYPKPHIDKIVAGVESVIGKGMEAIVFTGTEPEKAQRIKKQLESILKGKQQYYAENLKIVDSNSRQEENQKTAEVMSVIDIMVAASHERTNWAVGLGLPIFVLFPLIGTYAKQNFDFALKQRAAYPIRNLRDAKNLGTELIEIRKTDTLLKMIKSGFSSNIFNGAEFIADNLIKSE